MCCPNTLTPTTAISSTVHASFIQHAIRLFPLQISAKDSVSWAYWNSENDSWEVVDKAVLEGGDVPDGLEKLAGFEGKPDPSTGMWMGFCALISIL